MKRTYKKWFIVLLTVFFVIHTVSGVYASEPVENPAAEINGAVYATLKDAVSAAVSGDTIQLRQDIDNSNQTFIIGNGVYLDLAGHILRSSAIAFRQNGMMLDSIPGTGKYYGAIMYQTQVLNIKGNQFTEGAIENKGYVPVKKGEYYAFYNMNYLLERFGDKSGNKLNAFAVRPYVKDAEDKYPSLNTLFSDNGGVELKFQTDIIADGVSHHLTHIAADEYLEALGSSGTATLQILYSGVNQYESFSVTPIIETDLLRICGDTIVYRADVMSAR